ncbi:hypothetical protein ACJ41O_012841 [Fusarium nematophilum]
MSVLSDNIKSKWLFGSTIPYAEAPWARGCPSPHYRDSHRQLRQAMRSWVEEVLNLIPHIEEWEEAASFPESLYKKAADDGLLMPMASGASINPSWKGKYPIIGNIPAEEWDGYHDFIIHDEFGRVGGIGLENGLVGGVVRMYANYFLTLVKETTDQFTLLLIPRTEGVSTRHMTMSGSNTAGTAFVDFDDVQVPLDMVVGERGNGFKYVVSNFNHENLIYQLSQLSPKEGELLLAGTTAQLKAHAGIVLENVVREAIQILGGIGLTRGGRGGRVERIWRDVKALTVPGGSEEILLDLSTRRALKIAAELEKVGTKSHL